MIIHRLLLVLSLVLFIAFVPWSILIGCIAGIAMVFPFLLELVLVGIIMDAFAFAPFGLWSMSVLFFLITGALAGYLLRRRNIIVYSISAFAAILFWAAGMRLIEVFVRVSAPHVFAFNLPSALLLLGIFIGLGTSYVFYETQTKNF